MYMVMAGRCSRVSEETTRGVHRLKESVPGAFQNGIVDIDTGQADEGPLRLRLGRRLVCQGCGDSERPRFPGNQESRKWWRSVFQHHRRGECV